MCGRLETGATRGGPGDGAARLREFCAAVLDVVEAGDSSAPVPPAICRELTRALGEGARGLTDDLRRELRQWDAALEHLTLLAGSRYLDAAASASALRAELERKRALAARVVAALEAIQSEPGVPANGVAHAPPPRARTEAVHPPPSPPPAPAPPPSAETVVHGAGTVTLPTPRRERSERDGARPRPAPAEGQHRRRESGRAEPTRPPGPGAGRLAVDCPRCGTAGAVNWDRLNKVLVCPACRVSFAVRRDGTAAEVVRVEDGRWVEVAKLAAERRQARARRRGALGLVLAAGVLAAVSVSAWRVTHPGPRSEAELPRELAPRAELFARAWSCNDVPLMRRLTTPTHDRLLYGWYTRHRPPALAAVPPGRDLPEGVKVDVTPVSQNDKRAVVRARVTGLPALRGGPFVDLTLSWEERGGTWFFVPPAR